ncbi:MAG: bifunctional oligoribonuclease/PAP phosphatase NrnA [Spirochaetes bacterium]|nr:bifunctional oligoribonuclease/PAP phosphatase NrnA [Spirochaetota bacterium]
MDESILKIDKFIKKGSKFIITTHESPDADGVGAELAFKEILLKQGKHAIILNGDPTPEKIKFLDIDKEINIADETFILPDDIEDYALFVLDTNDFPNTGNTYNMLKDRISTIFIIDHHEGDQSKIEKNYIKVHASSASEIIYDIFKYYDIDFTFKSAQALYTGILFDTGSFRYAKTSPQTFEATSELVKKGADPNYLYEKIYENNDLNTFLLQAEMMKTVETHFDGKMVLMFLNPEMLVKTGAYFSDGEININIPLKLKGVEASVLIKQDINGPLKVSMRTKGDLDVSEIAIARHGGGHKNAAGYKSGLSLEETYKQVLSDMSVFFK